MMNMNIRLLATTFVLGLLVGPCVCPRKPQPNPQTGSELKFLETRVLVPDVAFIFNAKDEIQSDGTHSIGQVNSTGLFYSKKTFSSGNFNQEEKLFKLLFKTDVVHFYQLSNTLITNSRKENKVFRFSDKYKSFISERLRLQHATNAKSTLTDKLKALKEKKTSGIGFLMALFVEEVDERSNQTTNNLILISWGEKDDDDDELLQQHRNAIYKIFLGSNLYFADNNLEFSTGEDSEFKFVQSKINKLTQPILSTCKETFFENKIKNSINNCDFILFFESDQDLHVKNNTSQEKHLVKVKHLSTKSAQDYDAKVLTKLKVFFGDNFNKNNFDKENVTIDGEPSLIIDELVDVDLDFYRKKMNEIKNTQSIHEFKLDLTKKSENNEGAKPKAENAPEESEEKSKVKSQIVVEISKNEKKVIIYSWFENKENDQTIEAAHLEDFKQIFCTYIASKKAINQKNKNSKNPPNEDSNNPPNEDSKNQQRSLPENDVVTVYVSNINGKCVAWSVQTLAHASYTKTFNNLMSSLMDPFDRRRIQTQYVVSIDRDAEQKANSFWIKYVNRIPTDYERKKVHEQLEQHLGKDVLNNPLPIQGEVEHFELKDRSIAMLNGWNTQDETITLRLLGVTTVGKPNFAELKPSDMFLVVEFKVNEESENDVSPHQLLVYTCSTDTKTIDSIIKSNHRFNLFYVLGRFDLYERMAKSRVTKTWKIDGKPVYCTEFTQVHKMNAYQIKNRVAGLPLDFVLKIEGATDESLEFELFRNENTKNFKMIKDFFGFKINNKEGVIMADENGEQKYRDFSSKYTIDSGIDIKTNLETLQKKNLIPLRNFRTLTMYHILTKEANHDTQPTAIVIYSLIYCEQILEPEEAAKAHQASEFEVFNRVEFEKNMNKLSHCKYHHVDNSNKYVIVSKYSSSKRDLTPDESSTAKKKARVV